MTIYGSEIPTKLHVLSRVSTFLSRNNNTSTMLQSITINISHPTIKGQQFLSWNNNTSTVLLSQSIFHTQLTIWSVFRLQSPVCIYTTCDIFYPKIAIKFCTVISGFHNSSNYPKFLNQNIWKTSGKQSVRLLTDLRNHKSKTLWKVVVT